MKKYGGCLLRVRRPRQCGVVDVWRLCAQDGMTNAQVKKVINHTIAYFAEHLIIKGNCLPPTYKRTYGALPEQEGVAPPVPVL